MMEDKIGKLFYLKEPPYSWTYCPPVQTSQLSWENEDLLLYLGNKKFLVVKHRLIRVMTDAVVWSQIEEIPLK